jgi:alpha-N-acetylglucosamine transferase
VDYFFGALCLGWSIRRSGSPHDRVLLVTSDVPYEYRNILSLVWRLHEVTRVEHVRQLASIPAWRNWRFASVFTKLHCVSLTDYDKVLIMDLDVLIVKNIDHVFKLRAPAAMKRGNLQPTHGEEMDGSWWFPDKLDENATQATRHTIQCMLLSKPFTSRFCHSIVSVM